MTMTTTNFCCLEPISIVNYPLDYPNPQKQEELESIANALVMYGMGLLAIDETPLTLEKRFEKYGVEKNEEMRKSYRELLLTALDLPRISGVILNKETVTQNRNDGSLLIDSLKNRNIIPGVKLDNGTALDKLGTFEDSLVNDCIWAKGEGCHFAKWRCVFAISDKSPCYSEIEAKAQVLGRFAAICQDNLLVPIVEPEVLQEGNHPLERCLEVTVKVLSVVFKALLQNNVHLEGMLLKCNMVLCGKAHDEKHTPEKIALATVTALQRAVPVAVPGIVFLSGGQGEEEASLNLNAIVKHYGKKPWALTFSFGRALQSSALCVWKGRAENVAEAQQHLTLRCEANGLAAEGLYVPGMIPSVADRDD